MRLRPGTRRALAEGESIDVAGVFHLRYEARSPVGATPTTHQGTDDMARALVRQMLAGLGEKSLAAPTLTADSGPAAGTRFELGTPGHVLILGRAETCDGTLGDPDLSREHARVRRDWAGATLADLGSKNGTRVGDKQLAAGQEHRLADGDKVEMGGCLLYTSPSPRDS